jgi:hypothetical protein
MTSDRHDLPERRNKFRLQRRLDAVLAPVIHDADDFRLGMLVGETQSARARPRGGMRTL